MVATRRSWFALLCFALLASGAGIRPAPAQNHDVLVFAAASLKNALDDVAAQWQRETGKKAVISYAASNTLIKQIEQGAPADIFISADLDWMDYLAKRNLIKPETRANLLGNRLVLIAPVASVGKLDIAPNFPLAHALGDGRLARRAGKQLGRVRAQPDGSSLPRRRRRDHRGNDRQDNVRAAPHGVLHPPLSKLVR